MVVMIVIPTLWRWRQEEDQDFKETSLGYMNV